MRLSGLVRPGRIEQRQLPEVGIQARKMHELHLNYRDMFNSRIFRERKLHTQRLGKSHQIVEAFQTMKYRLRAQVMLLKRFPFFNALQQRIHVFINFQTLSQLPAVVITELFLKQLDQFINRGGMREMQHRFLLTRRVANQRRQRRHWTIAVRQHFGTHNRINGGRFPRFHGANNGQDHFQPGYFA